MSGEHQERRETDWLFNRINVLEDKMDSQHQRQRDHLDARFNKMEEMMREHEQKDDAIERRVAFIEAEKQFEKQQALKRGALAGVLTGIGFQAILQIVKSVWWK